MSEDSSSQPAAASTPRGRVLLVDDEEALRRACARWLEAAGFAVSHAGSGDAAARALAEHNFDVVITDINMPGVSGLDILRMVRERDLDLPVIIMTGNPTVETAAQAMEYGALRYLVKPIDAKILVDCVERAAKLRALARVKREVVQHLGDGDKLVDDRAGLETILSRGLDTLWMAYQPIVDFRQRKVIAYEALVRTREPALPHPGALFSVAERLDRVHDVGRAIRESVARTCSERDTDADVFINLHAADLSDETLFAHDAPLTEIADNVVLEITERVALHGQGDVPSRIRRLRDLGYRVAIDDLGAGYAGLSYFALLAPDIVKLDISLVRNIDSETIKQKLVGSLAMLCRDLGMRVVAEGIETHAELDTVMQLGADLLQGYLLARPGPPFPDVAW